MEQITRLMYWNESAGGWYDVETDVNVKNMTAPTDRESADAPFQLDEREIAQVLHARHYAEHFAHAGAPGHGQFLLIAKLSQLLDDERAKNTPRTVQKVTYDQVNACWRDIETGMKVQAP